jgi:hypothetical protein
MSFIQPEELAQRWAVTEDTLKNWRYLNKGPNFTRIGFTIRYRLADVEEYENKGLTITREGKSGKSGRAGNSTKGNRGTKVRAAKGGGKGSVLRARGKATTRGNKTSGKSRRKH